MFGLEMSELASRSLVFYLYATDKYTNTLIGEGEMKLGDLDLSQPSVTWLMLTDTGQVQYIKISTLFQISLCECLLKSKETMNVCSLTTCLMKES